MDVDNGDVFGGHQNLIPPPLPPPSLSPPSLSPPSPPPHPPTPSRWDLAQNVEGHWYSNARRPSNAG